MRVAALVAAGVFLAGCGGPPTGEVLDRDHVSAWCSTTVVNSGKTAIPVMTCYPEKWELRLRNGSGDEGWTDVTEAEYESHGVGSWFEGGSR
jgi:hypothetical protein